MARTSCCYATQPPEAGGLPGLVLISIRSIPRGKTIHIVVNRCVEPVISIRQVQPDLPHYPDASDMLILCDGGGSNSSSYYIFKEDLQAFSNCLGIRIRICHYPPYCSKYNLIEHRVFPHVTRACQGVPLESIETAKYYIEKKETTKGLKVVVRLLDKVYETGRKYAKDFKETMTIQFDKYLPKWNDTAIPEAK